MIIGILLWLSFAFSIIFFISGIINRSWKQELLSAVLFLPLSYYLFSIDNLFKYLWILPIFPLWASFYFRLYKKALS
ncbi:hypothetical protein ACUXCC_005358 [Cytobacillus horneckiae]|uniref:Uncharacterized protein n=1 Tax=Cytobacillus horneckiae TaxID=549687 RepID=A0A2N0ZKT2_9BACI|nr:hypothetical protein [Cytobacillus horneckiae]MBN6885536.1 hypothetical protein [Cytobacillus horneckiae]MEC1156352.1 hypothetical protein [Cytobacillus horneckiae]PKG30119.1 hypothetical protein CWS20_03760 [Cytobacillus horneckiae]